MVGDVLVYHVGVAFLAISSAGPHRNEWSSKLSALTGESISSRRDRRRRPQQSMQERYLGRNRRTMTTPSLAERAMISAQETVAGHSFSSASLMVATYLKFLIPKLRSADCSEITASVVSSKSDASQDCAYEFKVINRIISSYVFLRLNRSGKED